MLVISESGKGGGRVIFLAVFLSVCASVATTLWLHGAIEHDDESGRAPAPSRVIIPDAGREREAETIAQLKEAVARLEKVVETEPVEDGLETLLSIEQGERQIAIKDEVARLVRLGDEVVPEIVAELKSGRDRNWGGGFSFGGNMFKGYPRLRTALIDILRLIATPAAKQGLLEALRVNATTTDYRDLLLVYGTTTDARMIGRITEFIPDIVEKSGKVEGDRKGLLERSLVQWSQRHEVELATDVLAELCLRDSATRGINRDAFRMLLERDVERTYDVVARLSEDGSGRMRVGLVGIYLRGAPLARIAEFYERVFERMELNEMARTSIYHGLPFDLSPRVEAGKKRKEDARALLAWLKRRAEIEPDKVRPFVQSKIDSLEKAING